MKDLLLTINIHAGPLRINRLRVTIHLEATAAQAVVLAITALNKRWIQAEIVEQ